MELDAPFNATCDAPHKLQSSRKLANLDPLLEWLRLVPGRVALAHLALLAGIMLTGHATVPEQAEFPDPGLAAAVRGALGLGDSDPLPHSVLRHVRHLQATDRGIRSLDGLDQLTELESIQLVSNPLDSIVIPATLTKLTTLIAWDCPITNLVFLAGTASLEALTLVETKLSELVLPGTYPKLRLIQVSGDSLAQLSLSKELPALEELDIYKCRLDSLDLSGTALPKLERIHSSDTQIALLRIDDRANRLIRVSMWDNELAEVVLPAASPFLESISLRRNPLRRLQLPAQAPKLKELLLDFTGLDRLDLPASLPSFEYLSLEGAHLPHFDFSLALATATNIVVRGCGISSLVIPRYMTRLIELHAGGNPLVRFEIEGELPRLRYLDVNISRLESIEAFRKLSGLTSLALPSNNSNLTQVLAPLVQLTNLFISLQDAPQAIPMLPATLTQLTLQDYSRGDWSFLRQASKLSTLTLESCALGRFDLPEGVARQLANLSLIRTPARDLSSLSRMPSLKTVFFMETGLTNATIPCGLEYLEYFSSLGNAISKIRASRRLPSLVVADVWENEHSEIEIGPELPNLLKLWVDPLNVTRLVVSEQAAAYRLKRDLDSYQSQGVAVRLYPAEVTLSQPVSSKVDFGFDLWGPPGDYDIEQSSDMGHWILAGQIQNRFGAATFLQDSGPSAQNPHRFYRVRRLSPFPCP